MKGNRAVLTAVVILILVIAGWWLFKRSSRGPSIDLIATFDTAVKKPAEGKFQIVDADLNGDKKKAIFTIPPTRIIWKVKVPEDGWIKAFVGLQPDSWDKEGDGVLFRIGISDGRAFEDVMTLHVDPFHNKADRRWLPVFVDVSAYAGEDVELIYNAEASMPKTPYDNRNDTALFATPEIVVR